MHVTDRPLDELRKVVISTASVPIIAHELDVLGFRLADIFPDIFSLAREITNMHKPRLG